MIVTSIVLAAGMGSRMIGFNGNKTLLPLSPISSPYIGKDPILIEVLSNLPNGTKCVIINCCGGDVIGTIDHSKFKNEVVFVRQGVCNGAGGAVLEAKSFIESCDCNFIFIVLGDVPLITKKTYDTMLEMTRSDCVMTTLGFKSYNKNHRYGYIEENEYTVNDIVEWKYWKDFDAEKMKKFSLCNAGPYVIRKDLLLKYLPKLKPHKIEKVWNGEPVVFDEYLYTDIVSMVACDGYRIGSVEISESEASGVNTLEDLEFVQKQYKERCLC